MLIQFNLFVIRDLIKYVTSGPVLAMQLQGENAVARWRKMIGPTDPEAAIVEDPTSLRARFGTDKTFNGFHGSDSTQSALRVSISYVILLVLNYSQMIS
jgi:nucleoside-diphosphate kinase